MAAAEESVEGLSPERAVLQESFSGTREKRGILIMSLHGGIDIEDTFERDDNLNFVKGNAMATGVTNFLGVDDLKKSVTHLSSKKVVSKLYSKRNLLTDVAQLIMKKIKERDSTLKDTIRLGEAVVHEYDGWELDDDLRDYIGATDRAYQDIFDNDKKVYINKVFSLLPREKAPEDFENRNYDNSLIWIHENGKVTDLLEEALSHWSQYKTERYFSLQTLIRFLDERFEEVVLIDLSCMQTHGTLREKREQRMSVLREGLAHGVKKSQRKRKKSQRKPKKSRRKRKKSRRR